MDLVFWTHRKQSRQAASYPKPPVAIGRHRTEAASLKYRNWMCQSGRRGDDVENMMEKVNSLPLAPWPDRGWLGLFEIQYHDPTPSCRMLIATEQE
ncbi:hypothetical protein AO735_08710 [Pseudomonas sp. TTU2014-096BSC]|nr:hypothetical protein AO735_08710 [Pseudomonas sp. TTU2014-096BSC]